MQTDAEMETVTDCGLAVMVVLNKGMSSCDDGFAVVFKMVPLGWRDTASNTII